MHGSKKRTDLTAVKELQKEVERQADLIFQLRQDNANLKTKLANEKDMCKIYAERLRVLQNQNTSDTHSLEKNANDNSQPQPMLGGYRDGSTNDGVSLTIRTQLQTQHSEESGMDDSTCFSEHGDNQIDAEMEDHVIPENNAGKQRHGLFSQKGNQNQHRRNVSLRQLQARVHCLQQFCNSNKETAESPKVCKQRKNIEPLRRKTGEDTGDTLSRMGWAGKDVGRKLNQIKESYTQQTEVFDDDLRFMREVLNGMSRAPEMDVEVELDRLMKDFRVWRKQFEDSVKSLQARFKPSKPIIPRRCVSVSPRKLCSEPKKVTGRKSGVTASLGKYFHRSANGDHSCQERTVSGSQ